MKRLTFKSCIFAFIAPLFLFVFSVNSYADVDRKSGLLSYSDYDFDDLTRYYKNGDTESGLFGMGWKTVYDNRMEISNNGVLFVLDSPAGKYYEFELDEDNLWQGSKGSVTETPAGYIWSYKDASYVFNGQGWLVEYINSYNDKSTLEYDDSGSVNRFTSHGMSVQSVKTNDEGAISRLVMKDGSDTVEFSYSYKNGRLQSLKSPSGEVEYRYDDDGYIVYAGYYEDEPLHIIYLEFDNKKRVASYIQGEDKELYRYEMLSESANEKSYAVDYEENLFGENRHYRNEYYDVYVYGEFSHSKQIKKYRQGELIFDATYLNQCFPNSITRFDEKTDFTYDDSGRVIRKDSHDAIFEYAYNEINKLSYYQYTSKNNPENNSWTFFTYNNNKKLVEAKNSEGMYLLLQYDEDNRIVDMKVDDDILKFTYNAMGKPVRTEVLGVGVLNVSYDERGEVESVETEGGSHSVALKLTNSFSKMLDILKPANIDYSH